MREIKFRAWDKRKRRWLEAPLDDGRIFVHWRLDSKVLTLQDKKGDVIWCEFTGLKDKNGIEIYEGDVLRRVRIIGTTTWRVECAANLGCWDARLQSNPGGDTRDTFYPVDWREGEVIGSIYENPELVD